MWRSMVDVTPRPPSASRTEMTEIVFRHGGMVNWQVQYVKRRDAIPMTREYIHEESARLRASDTAPMWHLAPEARFATE